ncbi:unnamed protein product [Paramecium sonneborni]|uniref:WD40-repeat-containing domain n=1 Tax=Paramecium sonneborni TaxID=65129 RepID=A0A8S1RNR2_9CILI|nr:unnamed protein product [Paramecium sonneborni]
MKTESNFAKFKNQVEECREELQQEIESAYGGINVFLDSITLGPQSQILNSPLKSAPQIQLSYPSIPNLQVNFQSINQIKEQTLVQLQYQNTQQQKEKVDVQQNNKPFNYKIIHNTSIKLNVYCCAIAINKDKSIVLAACNYQIKVLEFKQEQLKQTQLLSEHSQTVLTLNFMKKSTHFISGSYDSQIIIWSMNQNCQWICQYKLNKHISWINCLILNNNEDIMISGSNDKTIKFWFKQNEWKCSQTITDHTNDVYGLSLNEQQNRLISCGRDKLILIIEQSSQDSKWNVIQKIYVDTFGYRLCFINDNIFTFQPTYKEQMYIYEMSSTNKQYSKTKAISVKSDSYDCSDYFPQQYIKQKCLLVNKNGSNVNLIRKNH